MAVVVAAACYITATQLWPPGYDWNHDYLSTLLRAENGPSRFTAIAGLLFFCAGIGMVFARLARTSSSSLNASLIRIGGVGSMVYAALTFTPMHDLVMKISVAFFVFAILAVLRLVYCQRAFGFLVTGCLCFVLLAASVTMYYGDYYVSALPWAQRILFTSFGVWLVALDLRWQTRCYVTNPRQSRS